MIDQQADFEGDDGSERTAVQRLLRLAEGARVFRAGDGRLFARVLVGNRSEVYDLRSGAFRDWLIGAYFRESGVLPSEGAIRRVIGALEAFARFGGGAPQVFIRVRGNDQRTVLHAQRPVILNGIEEFVLRGDLSDRTVFLHLAPILRGERRCEDERWAAFYRDRPLILGSLLDAVAGGVRELPSVNLAELPRMADFAAFAKAVGRAMGWTHGTVVADYNDNRKDATATQIEDSVVASALLARAPDTLNWWGTPTELLKELGDQVGNKVTSSAARPKSQRGITNELRRLAAQLRSSGVSVTVERTAGKRIICVRTAPGQEPYRHS